MADSGTKKEHKKAPEKDKNENITKEFDQRKEIPKNNAGTHIFFFVCALGVVLGLIWEILNAYNSFTKLANNAADNKLRYWVYSAHSDVENEKGLLKHLHLVMKRMGYEKSGNDTPWNLLWSHDYPFRVLNPQMRSLKPHQKVNHFPGTGYITNKVDFATTNSKYIPKAFKLPKNKKEFLKYAKEHGNSWFLEKDNQHRGIRLKNVSEIDTTSGLKFVQEYLKNPFLVDGFKFDIGVYVVLTSVDPLRLYWYKGDVLFRFCPAKYYPFDSSNLDKYVVADEYLPMWRIPALSPLFSAHGFSMKNSFDAYAKSKGKDPVKMWKEVEEAVAEVFINKEKHIIDALKDYPSKLNFFELMRVDFVVDEDLKVYLLEANMSPNLSADTKPPNQLLYEQLLYNLLSLVEVKRPITRYRSDDKEESKAASNMITTDKNVAVWAYECNFHCKGCEGVCGLCRNCVSTKLWKSFLQAHGEHIHRGDFKRLFPPSMVPIQDLEKIENMPHLTANNRLQYLWYQGKCNYDVTWCQ